MSDRNSTRAVFLGLAFVSVLAIPPSVSAQSKQSSGFVDDLTLDRFGMVRLWYTQVSTLRLRERILSLKQVENLLFAASDKGLIHCLDSETGKILWTQSISETSGEVFPPAVTKNFVYVCSNTHTSKLDRQTGQILLTIKLRSAVTSGPGSNDDFLYVQTVDDHLYAYAMKTDPEEAKLKWPHKRKFGLPNVAWFYNAGSQLLNPPIVLKDRVLFTAASGVVYASALNKKDLFYRFIPGAAIAAPVSFRSRTIYVATVDFNLFAVDAFTGDTRWRFPSGFPIRRQPVPFEEEVFLTPEGGGLFSLDDKDGSLRWVQEGADRVISVSQDRVYAMTAAKRFLILDRRDGAVLGSWFSPDFPVSAYNQTTDRIFLSTGRGLIQCIAEKRNAKPFLHEAPLDLSAPSEEMPSDPAEGDAEPKMDNDEMPAEKPEEGAEPSMEEPADDAPKEEMEKEEPAGDEPAAETGDERMEPGSEPAEEPEK
jgi:outer membrane protein assembly factor BamB